MEPFQADCAINYAIRIISGKWKLPILYYLLHGTKRFNELHRLIPDVSRQILTTQLRELEHDGIVHRKVYAEVPPRVEYSLTLQGRKLEAIFLAMGVWGENHRQEQKGSNDAPIVESTTLS
jgi:DNA-binding HxlR family transcriptional regulator